MTEYEKPLPRTNELTKQFWEGCKKRELLFQRCKDCGTYRFPPQLMCYKCSSINTEWSKVSGKGIVYSFIIPCRPSPGELPARGFEYPYAVVLVELSDAGRVRLASNMVDCKLEDIKIDMPVEVTFVDVTDEVTLPMFRPAK